MTLSLQLAKISIQDIFYPHTQKVIITVGDKLFWKNVKSFFEVHSQAACWAHVLTAAPFCYHSKIRNKYIK
jgi:hypothetical protein